MVNKEIKITIPEGYEIDKENSTFECIKFKKKALTYRDVAHKLFYGKTSYYPNMEGRVGCIPITNKAFADSTNATTSRQVERLLALNKLMNVAEYLNKKLDWGWGDDDDDDGQIKWYIYYDHKSGTLGLSGNAFLQSSHVYFDSKEHAKQAIEILGEDTIKCALGVK